ncbi:MAG: hypothetical protein COW55_15880 [Rhodobacteraceae bacterium CG17_big_fil_post_rev_8_21_14_2_50_65_11]|nr:MAG: hypothetical protein COW55_15880 [Rhodobacteraceae bacterium CG17_big_fil_post_rev_8_21_14_2_50_65_11]
MVAWREGSRHRFDHLSIGFVFDDAKHEGFDLGVTGDARRCARAVRAAVFGARIGGRRRGLNGLLNGGFNTGFNGGFDLGGKAGGAGKAAAQGSIELAQEREHLVHQGEAAREVRFGR